MSSVVEISDDDDSFDQVTNPSEESVVTSDEDDSKELPKVLMKTSRQHVITNLFPSSKPKPKVFTAPPKEENASAVPNEPKKPVFKRMIGGIEVKLPVDPYGSQVALMSQVITAIKKGQNCLLESPTGSGKTLALLCAALAWQKHEKDLMFKENTKDLFLHPDNKINGAEVIATPKKNIESPEKFFSKPVHGHKSIYDTAEDDGSSGSAVRQKHVKESPEGENGLVTIHKKRKLNDSELTEDGTPPTSPEKMTESDAESPENVSLPIIYYGARTHKQLQQVIKEYGRTGYCVEARMSVLSSRDNSCIREYDRSQWSSKNDMCKACIKKIEQSKGGDGQTTNCKYFDNRKSLDHSCLPDAFDLRDLVGVGEEMSACPYYAARDMAARANIVFCPYNYLIDPSIRRNLQINLPGNILVVDEAHNIEDICRDAASFTIARDQILAAMKELELAAGYRYSNQYGTNFAESLLKVMSNWDQWFANQTPLINQCAVNNSEASYVWELQHFLLTLHNHNIGQQQYPQFQHDADIFTKIMREDPQQMVGVTQATGNLIEAINTVLGYLFRDSGMFADNFKPVLQRDVASGGNTSWRSSNFNKSIERDSLSLRLICLNPAVVFEPLSSARCVILASGTLAPLVSLHSELGTKFPQQISCNHVIPKQRVWIGSLGAGADGGSLRCASGDTARTGVQDALGDAVLRVCTLTPHGVLCFLPSYRLMNILMKRWQDTGIWQQLEELKHVFMENKNAKDHDDIMEDYYKYVESSKGAILFAVYRGKVSEGMDFKDNQARAVIAVGIPYPNTYDIAVKQKMLFNDRHAKQRNLLTGNEWLRVQAYRALNQAVGRCVRHRGDWGAVLLVDCRYREPYYTQHLSGWAKNMLGNNHHTHASLVDGTNSLEAFMQRMSLEQKENRKA